jgi:hypothetical protein
MSIYCGGVKYATCSIFAVVANETKANTCLTAHDRQTEPVTGIFSSTLYIMGRDGDSLRVGRAGDRIPVEARFLAPVQTVLGLTQPPIQWIKRRKRGVDHPPSSSADIKGIAELYVYPPLGLHGLF